jgi:hypothetical protein
MGWENRLSQTTTGLQRRLEPPCDQSENLGPHPWVGFDHGALDGGVQMGLDKFADDGIEHMP